MKRRRNGSSSCSSRRVYNRVLFTNAQVVNPCIPAHAPGSRAALQLFKARLLCEGGRVVRVVSCGANWITTARAPFSPNLWAEGAAQNYKCKQDEQQPITQLARQWVSKQEFTYYPMQVASQVQLLVDCEGLVLIPGLIDGHVHVTASSSDLRSAAGMPHSLVVARAVRCP